MIFQKAWEVVKSPIDVYSQGGGRERVIGDDEMLYGGGDVRDDPRYFITDPDIAMDYALFGSAVPYVDARGRREGGGRKYPPMRTTIPAINAIDPSEYPEDEPGMMTEDPFSPGFGVMLGDYMDVGADRLPHEEVIGMLEDYISRGAYSNQQMGGSTAVGHDLSAREAHAKRALDRLRAYARGESLHRFIDQPERHEMRDTVFRTSEYDDFMENLGYDDSLAEMLGEWDDLEDWQREAATEVGLSEEDWI